MGRARGAQRPKPKGSAYCLDKPTREPPGTTRRYGLPPTSERLKLPNREPQRGQTPERNRAAILKFVIGTGQPKLRISL
jgi:hypothetical protein